MRCHLGQAPYFSSFSLKGPKRNQHRNIQEINVRENKSIEDKYVKCGVGGHQKKSRWEHRRAPSVYSLFAGCADTFVMTELTGCFNWPNPKQLMSSSAGEWGAFPGWTPTAFLPLLPHDGWKFCEATQVWGQSLRQGDKDDSLFCCFQ